MHRWTVARRLLALGTCLCESGTIYPSGVSDLDDAAAKVVNRHPSAPPVLALGRLGPVSLKHSPSCSDNATPFTKGRPHPLRSAKTHLISAVLFGMSGCLADPSQNVGFNEPDPHARIRAALLAAKTDDETSLSQLVRMLESHDAAERLAAIGALESITGQTLGFRHFDPEPVRAASIDRWHDWLAEAARSRTQTEARLSELRFFMCLRSISGPEWSITPSDAPTFAPRPA